MKTEICVAYARVGLETCHSGFTTLCETSHGLTPRTKFVFSRWFLVEIAASELFWCAAPAHLPRSRPASAESRRAWHGPGRLPSPPVARAPAEPQSWGDCGTLIRAGGAAQHAGKRCPGSAHARKARPHRPCMASNRSVKPQNFYSPSSPPLWQVGGRRRSSSHDQKLVMASSRRALGGRIFADVLGRCGAEASLNGGAPLRFKLIPNSLPQCPSSLPCAASLAHFSVARSSTELYPPAPALCPAASNPSCLVSSQTRAVCPATIKPRARSARAASRFPMRARCAPVEAQASTGPCLRTLEPRRRRSPGS